MSLLSIIIEACMLDVLGCRHMFELSDRGTFPSWHFLCHLHDWLYLSLCASVNVFIYHRFCSLRLYSDCVSSVKSGACRHAPDALGGARLLSSNVGTARSKLSRCITTQTSELRKWRIASFQNVHLLPGRILHGMNVCIQSKQWCNSNQLQLSRSMRLFRSRFASSMIKHMLVTFIGLSDCSSVGSLHQWSRICWWHSSVWKNVSCICVNMTLVRHHDACEWMLMTDEEMYMKICWSHGEYTLLWPCSLIIMQVTCHLHILCKYFITCP